MGEFTPNHFNINRLYKTLSFQSDQKKQAIRIKAIAKDGTIETLSTQKTIPVNILPEDLDSTKLRVRTQLSMANQGVRTSYWVTQEKRSEESSGFNQYRIKGIAKNGTESDWVYSNIKDQNNEDIIFELLHDIFDMLIRSEEDHLNYSINSHVEDILISLLNDNKPSIVRNTEFERNVSILVDELKDITSDSIMNSFKENILVSLESFVSLMKTYSIEERFIQKREDFFYMVLDSYLQDYLDEIVEKSFLTVFIDRPDDKELILQDFFEEEFKDQFMKSLYDINLKDSFNEQMDSTALFILSKEVEEEICFNYEEDKLVEFQEALRDVYLPLLLLENTDAIMGLDIHDDISLKPKSFIIEYDLYKEDELDKRLFIQELINLLLIDRNSKLSEVSTNIIDLMVTPQIEKNLTIWINKNPLEVIDYLMQVGERASLDKANKSISINEVEEIDLLDMFVIYKDLLNHSVKDSLTIATSDYIETQNHDQGYYNVKDVLFETLDRTITKKLSIQRALNEDFFIEYEDELLSKESNDIYNHKEHTSIFSSDDYKKDNLSMLNRFNDDTKLSLEDIQYKNFMPFIRDTSKQESELIGTTYHITSALFDFYTLRDEEDIYITYNPEESSYPLGKFILGKTTFQGKLIN